MVNPRTFFDLAIEDVPAGRVVFELFNDEVPKTVEKLVEYSGPGQCEFG